MLSVLETFADKSRRRQGFTLIELLVVIVIIGMLATLAVGYLNDVRQRAKEVQTAANLSEIQKGLEQFAVDNGGMYPFRIRWFNDATVNSAKFDPYEAVSSGQGMTSDAPGFFSLGLFGGVKVVTDTFSDNTWDRNPTSDEYANGWMGMAEHHVIQPWGWDYSTYQVFNQYTDPLYALGYLKSYPSNPFMKRPMGNTFWGYGTTNGGQLDKTIPSPNVIVTPGDFCYTFFYGARSGVVLDPPGVVQAKVSYVAKSPTTVHDGKYYVDVVDSYQLWAYGVLPLNAARYVAYPNNAAGLVVRGRLEAKKDFDNSGTKDMFEMGIIAYYKRTGSVASQGTSAGGSRVEF